MIRKQSIRQKLADELLPKRFGNVEMEQEFLHGFRVSGLAFTRACFFLAAAMAAAFVVAIHLRHDLLGADLQRQAIRAAIAVVLAVSWWLLGRNRQWIEQHYVLVVGGVIAITSCGLSLLAAAPALPHISDPFPSKIPMAVIIVLWLSYTFPRLPTPLVTVITAIPTATTVIVAWGQPADFPIAVTLYLAVAHSIGIVLGMQVERRERAVFAHARDLERANAEIAAQSKLNEDLSAAKSLVLASVSHDLRQPLSSLSLYVNMLRTSDEEGDHAEVARCAEQMQTCVSAMEGNLGRILEISRMQNRDARLPVGPVDLCTLFISLRTIFGPAAAAAGIRLVIREPVPGALVVCSNRERLHEVLSNLLSNAIKFAGNPRRGESWVHVSALRTRRGVRIDVRDNGIGIAPEHHARVFDEYYQVGNPARNSTYGYGLGLAVVRATIGRLEGHQSTLYSRLGHGSRFSVYAPIFVGAAQRGAAPISAPEVTIHANGSENVLLGSLVLVVEDDDSLREALAVQLSSWGAVVETAATCAEALTAARNGERLIDAILTDLKLPGNEDGIEVIRQVRGTQPHCVAAVLTSGEYAFDRLRLADMEAVRFLPKPIEPEVLRAELAHAIRASLAAATQLQ